ncbi:MAG: TetR/AcrR family transcriptional regulator [bacterium]|nr:TetR/AcrR family transcriptional regulator [bacterium]
MKKDTNKNLILRKAYSLFLKNGYNGTSMRVIGKESGVSMGGIYAHYANKHEIYKSVFEKYHPFNNMPIIISKYIDQEPEDYFLSIALNWLDKLSIDSLQLMFIDKVEFQGELSRYFYHQIFAGRVSILLDYIRNNVEDNKLKKYKPETIVHFFFKLLISNILPVQFIHNKTKENIKEELKVQLKIFLNGVLA